MIQGATRAAFVLLAGLGATLASTGAAQAAVGPRVQWRVGWATAMDDLTAPSAWTAHPILPGTPTEPQVAYRFIVRPTVSGSAVRLRFSNPRTPRWRRTRAPGR